MVEHTLHTAVRKFGKLLNLLGFFRLVVFLFGDTPGITVFERLADVLGHDVSVLRGCANVAVTGCVLGKDQAAAGAHDPCQPCVAQIVDADWGLNLG